MKNRNINPRSLYNKVWGELKERIGSFVRRKCDAIPQERRLTVVAVLLTVFVLTAFFVFGNACYRMGKGKAATEMMEVEHIDGISLPDSPDSDSLMVEYKLYSLDESEGTENENK